jgi:hypothetical protein
MREGSSLGSETVVVWAGPVEVAELVTTASGSVWIVVLVLVVVGVLVVEGRTSLVVSVKNENWDSSA